MSKITARDIAKVAAAHYGVPTTEILAIMKTPTNPATLRDEFAVQDGTSAKPTTTRETMCTSR